MLDKATGTQVLLIGALMVWNLFVCWLNAWQAGKAWPFRPFLGIWGNIVLWSAAVMSATGFSICFLFVGAVALEHFQYIDAYWAETAMNLGVLVALVPLLTSGFFITIHSAIEALRRPSLLNGATAAYNIYAQIENMYSAYTMFPQLWGSVLEAFTGGGSSKSSSSSDDDDDKNPMVMFVVLLVVAALLAGVFLTTAIIRTTARRYAVMYRQEFDQRERQLA